MNWDINECKNLTDKTKTLFFTSGMIYNPFQALCNWLYATKYSYSDRKRDSSREITVVILAEEHIDKTLELDKKQKDVLLDIVFTLAMKKDFERAKTILNTLDNIKKDIRLKFKQLTPQEMQVFSVLYNLLLLHSLNHKLKANFSPSSTGNPACSERECLVWSS